MAEPGPPRSGAWFKIAIFFLSLFVVQGKWAGIQNAGASPKTSRKPGRLAGMRRGEIPKKVSLPAGRWDPAVRGALEELIAKRGNTAAGYSEQKPPCAVFVLDNVSMVRHAGEAMFRHLVTQAKFKFNEHFWRLIPPRHVQKVRMAYASFKEVPPEAWRQDPYYAIYRKEMFASYQELCKDAGLRVCYPWLAKLLAGFSNGEILRYAEQVIEGEQRLPVGWEKVEAFSSDENPLRAATGLREIREIKDLIAALRAHGFDVWLMSPSNQWAAAVLAEHYGVDASRVVGIRCRMRNTIVVPEIAGAVPVGIGQAEVLTAILGRAPDLSVGGKDDMALLDYGDASGKRLFMDSGDEELRARAGKKGWLLQPSFVSMEEASQRVLP